MKDVTVQQITIPSHTALVWHDPQKISPKVHIHLKHHSSLIWIHEYPLADAQHAQISLEFFLDENSSLHFVPVLQGNPTLDFALTVNLEKGAHAAIAGVYFLADVQKYSIRTLQHHHGPNAKSILRFNGVAADQSFVNYQGRIVVEKTASITNASQENKTILWGTAARAVSIPALEIKTNEVQCAHGSAIGPLNKEHIQYIQSRGLCVSAAQNLLLTSFFAETLAMVQDEAVKMRIISKLVSHLLGT